MEENSVAEMSPVGDNTMALNEALKDSTDVSATLESCTSDSAWTCTLLLKFGLSLRRQEALACAVALMLLTTPVRACLGEQRLHS